MSIAAERFGTVVYQEGKAVEGPGHRRRLQLSPQEVLFLSDVSAGLDADRPTGSVTGFVMHAGNTLL